MSRTRTHTRRGPRRIPQIERANHVHLDSYVGKMVDATEEFKTHLLPLLDMMQSMLSKRGKLRKLLNIAAVPMVGRMVR